MAGWSLNNQAHRNTWFFLFQMNEVHVGFNAAGALTMKELSFHVPGDSSDMLRTKAKALAAQLDNQFRNTVDAKYEPKKDQGLATAAMTLTLLDDEKTVGELGDVVDDNYHFLNEPSGQAGAANV